MKILALCLVVLLTPIFSASAEILLLDDEPLICPIIRKPALPMSAANPIPMDMLECLTTGTCNIQSYQNIFYNCQDFSADFWVLCNSMGYLCFSMHFDCGTPASGHALNLALVEKGGELYWAIVEPQDAEQNPELMWGPLLVKPKGPPPSIPNDVIATLCPKIGKTDFYYDLYYGVYFQPQVLVQWCAGQTNDISACTNCCANQRDAYHDIDCKVGVNSEECAGKYFPSEENWVTACYDVCTSNLTDSPKGPLSSTPATATSSPLVPK